MSNNLNLADSINFAWRSGKTPTFIYNSTTYDFSPAGLIAFLTAEGTLPVGVTATAAEINAAADFAAQAITSTADGLTTGTVAPATKLGIVTSAAATDAVTLPGIAANSLGIGHTIRLRVGANGYELLTLATTNETINGVDSDGTNQMDVAANTIVEAIVESATGWMVSTATATAPDND